LKNAEIKPSFSAKGLKEANEKLDTMKLPEKERVAYDKYLLHMMSIASRNHTIEIEAKEIIKKAHEEKEIEFILEMEKEGLSVSTMAKLLKELNKKFSKSLIARRKSKPATLYTKLLSAYGSIFRLVQDSLAESKTTRFSPFFTLFQLRSTGYAPSKTQKLTKNKSFLTR
jgi:hypothetical protein